MVKINRSLVLCPDNFKQNLTLGKEDSLSLIESTEIDARALAWVLPYKEEPHSSGRGGRVNNACSESL